MRESKMTLEVSGAASLGSGSATTLASSTAVGAALGVDALVGKTQTLNGPAAHQMLLHDLRGISGLHMAVPDGVGVNHHRRPVFALVQTEGLVDAHGGAETGRFRKLLQLGMEFAFSVGSAGRAGRIGGTDVVADKNMTFKRGQAVFLLGVAD
jgi:hypothetical protein